MWWIEGCRGLGVQGFRGYGFRGFRALGDSGFQKFGFRALDSRILALWGMQGYIWVYSGIL